jgi:hypothetical protein
MWKTRSAKNYTFGKITKYQFSIENGKEVLNNSFEEKDGEKKYIKVNGYENEGGYKVEVTSNDGGLFYVGKYLLYRMKNINTNKSTGYQSYYSGIYSIDRLILPFSTDILLFFFNILDENAKSKIDEEISKVPVELFIPVMNAFHYAGCDRFDDMLEIFNKSRDKILPQYDEYIRFYPDELLEKLNI